MESQTPSLPDPSALKDLSPSVAITFLIAVVIVSLLVYFGGPIRDRMKRRTDPPAEERPRSPSVPAGPAPKAAVDAAERRTEQFIDNLLRQVETAAAENDRLEQRAVEDVRRRDQRIEDLERQVQQLRDERASLREENQQLRMQVMWRQRGPD